MAPIELQDGAITNNKTVIIMTDNKKEQERNELHRTIWAIADEMRGYFEVVGEDEGSE